MFDVKLVKNDTTERVYITEIFNRIFVSQTNTVTTVFFEPT